VPKAFVEVVAKKKFEGWAEKEKVASMPFEVSFGQFFQLWYPRDFFLSRRGPHQVTWS